MELAKAACKKYSNDKPRFIAGAIGPTTKALSVTGGISFDDLSFSFYEQAKALIKAGVDYLFLETALDTLNLKAAYIGITKARALEYKSFTTIFRHSKTKKNISDRFCMFLGDTESDISQYPV